jgi:UPF0176 protein
MLEYTNASAYLFTPLSDLKTLRNRLLTECRDRCIKGTILLSTEGINLFVAGKLEAIEWLLDELRSIPGLQKLTPKLSISAEQPFTRMLVRIKKEIIAFGVPGIDPGVQTSPRITAKELKKWLDEGKDFVLLDTRNDYEVKLGTFSRATAIGTRHFRDFPSKVQDLPSAFKTKPVVTFCTGGIRCEKAAPYLETQGFKNVFQLDGGILKYFEECGNTHYQGDCFVFDQRVGVDPSLNETPNGQCFACLTPLTLSELNDSRYVLGRSCPYCYKTDTERVRLQVQKRNQLIEGLAEPLPGSTPYQHFRPLSVPGRFAGASLIQFLQGVLPHVPTDQWVRDCSEGRILNERKEPLTVDSLVAEGERILYFTPFQVEPSVDPRVVILYEDEAMIVLRKPAPLPIHPSGRFNRNTLKHFLDLAYSPQKPHAAHRLDANTTGLMVAARTKRFAAALQTQFEKGEVEKHYLALVHGHPPEDFFSCELPISEQTLDVGARFCAPGGLASRTDFRVLFRLEDGTSLLEVVPHTGRTNQIRVHLWELGVPIVGDQLYLPERRQGLVQTHRMEDPPLCLHAYRLKFRPPLKSEPVVFEDRDFLSAKFLWGKVNPLEFSAFTPRGACR